MRHEFKDAPEEMNKIMEAAYSSALKKYKGNKAKASKIAIGAAEDAGWKKVDGKWTKTKKEMSEIVIDAFKEGKYPQGEFTGKELSEIASTYNPENYEAPILIGHLSDPSYKGKSSIPAYGWIGAAKVVGDHLKLVVSQFSDQLKEFIQQGFYKKVSAAFFQPDDPNNPTPGKWHLHHLAFLGGTPPAVKGLEGIAFTEFSSIGIEFAETDTSITGIDVAEEMGTEDTIKDLTESCATFISKIQDTLTSDIDADTQQSRCSLAAYDLQTEIQDCLGMHWTFQEKLENIEEHNEAEMSEKKSIKQVLIEMAQSFINKGKESSDMEKEQETRLVKENEDLKKQVKEFSEAKQAADLKAKQAEEKAADVQLLKDVKEFCEKNKLTTKKHQDMKIQEILFATAKANQTIEFAAKDKDGKDTLEKMPVLTVLQNALKSLQIAVPPEGEMAQEFAEEDKGKKPEAKRSDFIAKVDAYIEKHATEFSGLSHIQARAKVITLESNQKIKL